MYPNKNLVNTIYTNDSNNEDSNKPALTKLKNKRKKAVSNLQLSFELFRKKLYDSERNSNVAAEDTINIGSNSPSNEKLQSNEEPVKQVSNDIKLIWLQSALNFIKNDHQTTLIFPTISVEESDFIQAILNQDSEPDLDSRFSAIYLSLREALIIYQTKYIFALNTVFKGKATIKLELEKIPKNNKLKFAKMSQKYNKVTLSKKKIEKRTKLVNDKMSILNAVPMQYIINCYKQILEFLDDDLRFTITFDKLLRHEYEFITNVKQIVKSREVLEAGLPEELNTLLECIATHKDYAFSLIPNRAKHEEKYVIIMKVPKGGDRGNFQIMEDSLNNSQEFYNVPETKTTEPNNNKILYRKIDNSIKNTNESNTPNLNNNCPGEKQIDKEFNNNIFKSNNYTIQSERSSAYLREQCNSWENIDISHWQPTATESFTIYNEKKLTNQLKSIQFQRGGSVDVLNDEHTSNVRKLYDVRCRSWSRDKDANKMKNKMYEALLVPLTSSKAIRMMQLMGWKGGALGSRGQGITEPIMPAIGIQPGAGLGHGSNSFKMNEIPKKEPPPVPVVQPENIPNRDKFSKKTKRYKRNYTVIKGEETRLKILSKILEFIKSCEPKMVLYFDEVLKEEDTRFVICSTDRFNRRKYVRNLQSQYGADDLRKVQEVMLTKPHMNLAAKISEDNKEIVLTKTLKGENNNETTQDFTIDTYDSIRSNISVYRYIKTMKPRESYDINLYEKYTEFLKNFVDVINMGRKPRYATEAEESLVEKIYNKIGDYCLILDVFRPLKIIKLQKKSRNTQDSGVCESKNNEQETKELIQTEDKNVSEEKQNNDNLNQLNTSLEFHIEKTVEIITTNIMNNLSQIYGKGVNSTVSEDTLMTQENTQTLKEPNIENNLSKTNNVEDDNEDIITIDLTEENVQINETKIEQVQNTHIQDFIQEQAKENFEYNIENEKKDTNEENIEVTEQEIDEKDLSIENEDILKIIDDLEKSIKLEEPLNEEHNQKRNRSDSNDSQLQNTKKI
ncbi:hypothetical protein RR46_12500 [Papilio xuthus]|uniref:G-patch domain-containing protein n=1 Tax=Papilio xuthus TaxID=66420 RepID=A0A194PZ88_PAPXU|nr:hypothetical protein RR46_12500 [Papilio xuthus]